MANKESVIHKPDKASYRNRGGIIQRAISFYKAYRYLTKCGVDVVIKGSASFRMVENAVLEVGEGSTILDHVFFQLTLPNPQVSIGKFSVIGRGNIITIKNRLWIGDDVLIGSNVQIIDHSHGIDKNQKIRQQSALIGEVRIEDDVWIGAGAKVLMNSHIGRGAVIWCKLGGKRFNSTICSCCRCTCSGC